MGVTLRTVRDLPQFFCGVVGRGKCKFLGWDLNIKHCFSEMKYFCSLDNRADDCLGPKLGILFKGGRNLGINQDWLLKNFVSELTVRLGILILDMDNEKKKNLSCCRNKYIQSPVCQLLEIKEVVFLALQCISWWVKGISRLAEQWHCAIRKWFRVFLCCCLPGRQLAISQTGGFYWYVSATMRPSKPPDHCQWNKYWNSQ